MNAAAAAAFAVAALFAAGNWVACARREKWLEYVCKPATLAALITAACVLDPVADAQTRRAWFVAALIASLAGDVLLMLERELFVFGLGAFLVAHLAYVAGFWTTPPGAVELALALLVTVAAVAPLARRVVASLAATPGLRPPVVAYIAVISAMLASALASGNAPAAAGAALFVASDTMIAWNRFVRPFGAAAVAIMVTYHLGQAGLVLSLLR